MQYFVYIGKDSKTINLFSKLSIGVFYAASNCNQAIKVLDKIREKYDTALFFEQINLSQDIANIHYMRKKYPVNPEKPDVPLNKNDAFQKVQKRHVQEKR